VQGSEHLPSQTTETIQGAPRALEQARCDGRPDQERQFAPDGRDLSLSSTENNGYEGKLGVAPWHRRKSQDTILSITSTVRDLLRGKTLVSTPNTEMEYGDYRGNKYSKGMHWSFNSGTLSSNIWASFNISN
jgi:parafibromin